MQWPLLTLGVGLILGGAIMTGWACWSAREFAAIAERGAFGDSLGPAVGLISSLALGAEHLRDARLGDT